MDEHLVLAKSSSLHRKERNIRGISPGERWGCSGHIPHQENDPPAGKWSW